jgi:hypothetical protein
MASATWDQVCGRLDIVRRFLNALSTNPFPFADMFEGLQPAHFVVFVAILAIVVWSLWGVVGNSLRRMRMRKAMESMGATATVAELSAGELAWSLGGRRWTFRQPRYGGYVQLLAERVVGREAAGGEAEAVAEVEPEYSYAYEKIDGPADWGCTGIAAWKSDDITDEMAAGTEEAKAFYVSVSDYLFESCLSLTNGLAIDFTRDSLHALGVGQALSEQHRSTLGTSGGYLSVYRQHVQFTWKNDARIAWQLPAQLLSHALSLITGPQDNVHAVLRHADEHTDTPIGLMYRLALLQHAADDMRVVDRFSAWSALPCPDTRLAIAIACRRPHQVAAIVAGAKSTGNNYGSDAKTTPFRSNILVVAAATLLDGLEPDEFNWTTQWPMPFGENALMVALNRIPRDIWPDKWVQELSEMSEGLAGFVRGEKSDT